MRDDDVERRRQAITQLTDDLDALAAQRAGRVIVRPDDDPLDPLDVIERQIRTIRWMLVVTLALTLAILWKVWSL